jgi:hypothetical protein
MQLCSLCVDTLFAVALWRHSFLCELLSIFFNSKNSKQSSESSHCALFFVVVAFTK